MLPKMATFSLESGGGNLGTLPPWGALAIRRGTGRGRGGVALNRARAEGLFRWPSAHPRMIRPPSIAVADFMANRQDVCVTGGLEFFLRSKVNSAFALRDMGADQALAASVRRAD